MTMTVAELRSEIKKRYEDSKAIEDKYTDGLTPEVNHEDYEQVKKLLGEVDTMEDLLAPLEEADERKRRIDDNVRRLNQPAQRHQHAGDFDPAAQPQVKDVGLQFIESAEWKQMNERGMFNSNNTPVAFSVPLDNGTRMMGESKALMYSDSAVGGGLVFNDRRPGIIDILQRQLDVLDLIPRVPTGSDTIEYVREDTFTNAAAFTAEATATTGTTGTKPESALAYSTQTSPVRTMAHWIAVTNRMLGDAPSLRGLINQRLLLGLDLTLETQIVNGNGSGENLTGIMNTAGTLIQGMGTDNPADAIYKGRTQVMVTGLARPNAVVIHPNDWQGIRLMRENAATGTLGGYLYGDPSVAGPMTIFGMPVVEALGAVEGTSIVGDFAIGCTLFDREQGNIRTGLINDQFVRNLQTILAELRVAFIVWRPSAFARVTGI